MQAICHRWALVALLAAAVFAAPAPQNSLTVLAVSPSTSSASASSQAAAKPVRLAGREAVTVTFSRAVIPLGADFGPGGVPAEFVPFTLSPSVAGKLRWVTTSIAQPAAAASAERPPTGPLTFGRPCCFVAVVVYLLVEETPHARRA